MARICGNVENIYETIHVSRHTYKGVLEEEIERENISSYTLKRSRVSSADSSMSSSIRVADGAEIPADGTVQFKFSTSLVDNDWIPEISASVG